MIKIKGIIQAASSFWTPFEKQFGNNEKKLRNQYKQIHEEVKLTENRAAIQEREHQEVEQYEGRNFRKMALKDSEENRERALELKL